MEQALIEEKESSGGFDFKRYLSKLAKNWYWFILAVGIFGTGAFLYLRYTLPLYKINTFILVKKPSDGANMIGGSAFSNGGIQVEPTNINNEIFKLQSAVLIGEVVDSLKLDISLTTKGRVIDQPVDLDSLPFDISIHKWSSENKSPAYQLTMERTSYSLETDHKKITGTYNQPLVINGDTLIIHADDLLSIRPNTVYKFQYSGRISAITNYIARVNVSAVPKAGPGVLQVTVSDEFPRRAKKFIGVLIHRYDIANLDFNNQSIKAEMDFLNNRIAVVSAELDSQAKLVRDFKAGNKVFDVSSSANQLLSTLPSIDAKRNDYTLKRDLLNIVETNINSYNGKEEIVPNSSGLQDAVLADQINRYNQLVLQKRQVLDKGTSQDPRLPSINGQMQEIRSNILKNVKNIRNEIQANYSSIAAQERNITGRFTSMPAKEKQLIELNRVLEVKQSLYTFLLQKREDKNIQLASSEIAESRIIDNGLDHNMKIPDSKMVYAIALGLGLILPTLIMFLQVFLNKRIETRNDIEGNTNLIIAGEIAKAHTKDSELVITSNSVSPEAEQFRTLRTNISYLLHGLSEKSIMITSGKSAEGKSFISLNLANSIAISGKKVALLEFDIRNPGLAKKMGISDTVGLSNYLLEEADIKDIIQPTNTENLFFLSSGAPLPANAGELILNNRMPLLFKHLKEQFDVIVIDTPPVGPVSDALTLSKWADYTFFVVRHRFTLRSSLQLVNKLHEEQKLPNIALIINGIQSNQEFNYGNDYGYGYGYQTERKKKRIFANV